MDKVNVLTRLVYIKRESLAELGNIWISMFEPQNPKTNPLVCYLITLILLVTECFCDSIRDTSLGLDPALQKE